MTQKEKQVKNPRIEDFQTIIQIIERGGTYRDAEKQTQFGAEYIQRFLRNYKSWWEQDWNKLIREAETGHVRQTFCVFCADKTGIAAPEELLKTIQLKKEARRIKPKEPEAEAPKQQNATVPESKPQSDLDNTALYLCKIIEAMAKQNELLEQLMDVVIQKHVSDIKDNINGNSDIMHGEVVKIAQTLDAIKCNTRKRGM